MPLLLLLLLSQVCAALLRCEPASAAAIRRYEPARKLLRALDTNKHVRLRTAIVGPFGSARPLEKPGWIQYGKMVKVFQKHVLVRYIYIRLPYLHHSALAWYSMLHSMICWAFHHSLFNVQELAAESRLDAAFTFHAVEELRKALRAVGSDLVVRFGDAAKEVAQVVEQAGASHLFYHAR